MAFSGEIEKLERRWQENPLGLTFAPLAEAYRKAGDPARALELLEQGLAQHPNYVPGHIVRGRCHLDTQEDSAAELAFLRVTGLDPENVIALKGLSELSERAGRLPEAIHRLELLLDVDRNNEEARGQLDRVRELLATRSVADGEMVPPASATEPVYQEPSYHEPAPPTFEAPEVMVAATPETFQDDPPIDIELEAASQLQAATSHEYQIDNDSEKLRPTDQRSADIFLGAEPPGDDGASDNAGYAVESVPPDPMAEPGGDRVNGLLGDGYERMAYQDVPTPPVDAGDPMAPSGPTIFEQIALMPEVPVPVEDLLPPPLPPSEQETFLPPAPPAESEPVPAMEAEPVAESAAPTEPAPVPEPVAAMADGYVVLGDLGASSPYEPAAPVQAEESEPSASEEPELVVTETMAEIFLRQGHRELALAVYSQLAQREPDNERIAAALTRLAPEPSTPPARSPEPAERFAASETGGRSVADLLRLLLSASRPTPASAIHPPAFEQPKRATGEPTRPAQESLSLSAVFGEEAAPAGPAGGPPEGAPGEPSFDEFFAPATGPSADTELPHAPDSAAQPAQVPEDLEQFNAWLRGLKR